MVDPDAPSPSDPSARSWVHWLVINIPGDKISQGVRMAGYDGPTPPPGTGLHRYVLLAFSQEAQIGSPKFTGISGFNVEDFIKNNNLHPTPVAGNFFRAQDDGTV
ncbi:Phosphatidylethanolamine-binding protein PEBP [Aphelenchoides avenae]|nr:Phosphatidylethanolamine-binding protein PEBP [Aphelenchus avenae]